LIGPALFPVIEVGLRFGEALEALPFQWRLLGIPDARFHFAFVESRRMQVVRETPRVGSE
jgi:hypothetical protein